MTKEYDPMAICINRIMVTKNQSLVVMSEGYTGLYLTQQITKNRDLNS